MTRIPQEGRVKTRLIPVLGARGAADLHAALLGHTLRTADRHAQASGVVVEVRFTGDGEISAELRRGSRISCWRPQQGGDLGNRMHQAIDAASSESAREVIVVGADCPDLSPTLLDRAWELLASHDVVLGPAADGGYYLIGLKQAVPELFTGIDWGTPSVLEQTRRRCRQLGKSIACLPVLSDVDEPENLVVCRRMGGPVAACLPAERAGWLSVVIPTWNEANQLRATLAPILAAPHCEVVIADGGSTDGTVELAQELGCRVVSASRGRGRQMNAGAALSCGELVLFLHADTRLPPSFRDEVLATLAAPALAGAFRLRIDQPGWALRWIEWGANLRGALWRLPYGDQGVFLRADDFFRLGGFQNWPIMEDFEFSRRIRRAGPLRIAAAAASTSGRRWKSLGAARCTLRNQYCVALYLLGVSPDRIARIYSRQSSPRHS